MLPPFISDAKDKHPTFILSVIRSRMLPPLISDAKDKHPTFIFSVIRSRMLPPFISDAKDKHPTFILSVIRRQMLPPFISDAKDKHPTFILSVIRSRMLPPFISDANNSRIYFGILTLPKMIAVFFSVFNIYRKFRCVRYAPFEYSVKKKIPVIPVIPVNRFTDTASMCDSGLPPKTGLTVFTSIFFRYIENGIGQIPLQPTWYHFQAELICYLSVKWH